MFHPAFPPMPPQPTFGFHRGDPRAAYQTFLAQRDTFGPIVAIHWYRRATDAACAGDYHALDALDPCNRLQAFASPYLILRNADDQVWWIAPTADDGDTDRAVAAQFFAACRVPIDSLRRLSVVHAVRHPFAAAWNVLSQPLPDFPGPDTAFRFDPITQSLVWLIPPDVAVPDADRLDVYRRFLPHPHRAILSTRAAAIREQTCQHEAPETAAQPALLARLTTDHAGYHAATPAALVYPLHVDDPTTRHQLWFAAPDVETMDAAPIQAWLDTVLPTLGFSWPFYTPEGPRPAERYCFYAADPDNPLTRS